MDAHTHTHCMPPSSYKFNFFHTHKHFQYLCTPRIPPLKSSTTTPLHVLYGIFKSNTSVRNLRRLTCCGLHTLRKLHSIWVYISLLGSCSATLPSMHVPSGRICEHKLIFRCYKVNKSWSFRWIANFSLVPLVKNQQIHPAVEVANKLKEFEDHAATSSRSSNIEQVWLCRGFDPRAEAACGSYTTQQIKSNNEIGLNYLTHGGISI